MNISIIGRADNSGLATMSADFCHNMVCHRGLVMNRHGRGETVPMKLGVAARVCDEITEEDLEWLLDGSDCIG